MPTLLVEDLELLDVVLSWAKGEVPSRSEPDSDELQVHARNCSAEEYGRDTVRQVQETIARGLVKAKQVRQNGRTEEGTPVGDYALLETRPL